MKNDKQVLKFNPKQWDWYPFLNASEKIKEKYHGAARALAEGWTTCACGQVCDVLPKRHDSAPIDKEARSLGLLFNYAIHFKEWDTAKITLDKIEARTVFLLQQPNYIDQLKPSAFIEKAYCGFDENTVRAAILLS